MIIYEVNCLVEASIERPFLTWLKEHATQIVTLEGFEKASISLIKLDDRLDEHSERTGFSVTYRLENQAALDNYLKEYAPTLREDGLKRFGTQMTIYRRVLGGALFEVRRSTQ
ncbi:DUF4286 family protein [Endozoicomonas numazuensis]|uniref:DUF4286 domain-containing protein n=1 Tax=Endozoicomonas numazuensis TaxID=1137799 RepID=A0A081NF06_9GAMM|nr:DUF4286 family protein [Endozoicomonas numazuensis]KEQ17029.1 hypothetical protein GZ78_14060 [Endozoicomonas numazuensis]